MNNSQPYPNTAAMPHMPEDATNNSNVQDTTAVSPQTSEQADASQANLGSQNTYDQYSPYSQVEGVTQNRLSTLMGSGLGFLLLIVVFSLIIYIVTLAL